MNETTTTEVQNPALVRLVDVTQSTRVEDMNYIFNYTRVKNPDDVFTPYFALHYKEQQQENWSSCRNLLSDKFTVAKTAAVITQIRESLGGDIQSERHYRSGTSAKSIFTLSGFQIDVVPEPDINTVLFKLITNINSEINVLTSSNLTFNIINGYAGNHALQLSFGLLKTITANSGSEDRIVPINNIFLLDKYTKRLIHDNRMNISISDVVNVQQQIINQIVLFKRLNMTQSIFNDICEKLPKKFAKKFISLYDNLSEDIRNFYYCSFILSMLLDDEKDITLEIKLRDIIQKKIVTLELATTV